MLGRKVMTNLDSIIKSRNITLSTKVCLVKAMVFPVVMYRCENWTIKKTEHHIIDAFELWCWRRLLRVLWTARRTNQSVLKEFYPEYTLEWLMLKLKLQYFGHLMRRDEEALYSQQKQDWELTVAQIMNSLLPNSDLNWRKWGKSLDHSSMT